MKENIFKTLTDIESQAQELKNYVKILKNSIENENDIDYLWNFVDLIYDKTEENLESIENLRIITADILLK